VTKKLAPGEGFTSLAGPLDPLGVKGVGEGGAVAPPAGQCGLRCAGPVWREDHATPIKPEQLMRSARPR
jgi:hypothetical protein